MLELGKKSKKLHYDLSKIINQAQILINYLCTENIMHTYKYVNKNKRGNILQQNQILKILFYLFTKNDYLIIKGSNATGLNKLSQKIN